eukprot:TRINITY_DN14992_c0_g1_i1.p1 TRINITY_DN14992_c0_g1~~TRINITY_DN14992_c0_g1_i1.p1  ORF type:complete len:348 (-),score=21.15 TRINITY_DN14992_c0_g1_i1:84-1085(-)
MEAGKRYAVLAGCNYPDTQNELYGCVNDVLRMKDTLLSRFGFLEKDIRVLVDVGTVESDESCKPTGHNIISALQDMISQAKAGDVLFFHYSGHGTLLPRHGHDSVASLYDECIVPCDFNLITDEDLRMLVNEVPKGVTFTMISDSCHSGGLIDHEKEQIGPHVSAAQRKSRSFPSSTRKRSKFLETERILAILQAKTGEYEMSPQQIKGALFKLFGERASPSIKRHSHPACKERVSAEAAKKVKVDEGDVGILLSGCQTDETSADACPTGKAEESFGAFSDALQKVLQENRRPITNIDLVFSARKILVQEGYSQHPCLYCSDSNASAAFLCQT